MKPQLAGSRLKVSLFAVTAVRRWLTADLHRHVGNQVQRVSELITVTLLPTDSQTTVCLFEDAHSKPFI